MCYCTNDSICVRQHLGRNVYKKRLYSLRYMLYNSSVEIYRQLGKHLFRKRVYKRVGLYWETYHLPLRRPLLQNLMDPTPKPYGSNHFRTIFVGQPVSVKDNIQLIITFTYQPLHYNIPLQNVYCIVHRQYSLNSSEEL